MAKILAFSVQTPAHTFPFVPLLLELQQRGHAVAFGMFQNSEQRRIAGIRVRRLPWNVGPPSPVGGLAVHYGEPLASALERLISEEHPDFLIIDPMLWGGMIAAEASGLPWASLSHNPKTIRGTTLDARGPGIPPPTTAIARVRAKHLAKRLQRRADRGVPAMNEVRRTRHLPELSHLWDFYNLAPLTIATTAHPFEYARDDWAPEVKFVGPLFWEPPSREPSHTDRVGSPPTILLVGSSIEERGPSRCWIYKAIDVLADEPYEVVVTLPAGELPRPPSSKFRVTSFLPHSKILPHAACVVCHGGSGIVHKALSFGVPVVAVPFAYDRMEVGRRLEVAKAGVMLPGRSLTTPRLRAAISRALTLREGAQRVREGFAAAGGAPVAADHVEALLA